MYDGVLSFCHGLKSFDASHEIRPANVSCEREQSWPDGLSLLNYINSVCVSIVNLFNQSSRRELVLCFIFLMSHPSVVVVVVVQSLLNKYPVRPANS